MARVSIIPPDYVSDRGAFVLGWLLQRIACVVGLHAWMFDESLAVAFYGTGHEQCLVCGLVRVKP